MKSRVCCAMVSFVIIGLVLSLVAHDIQADAPFDDLTPNQYTFAGRRGTAYTATWDPATYEVTFSTPDGTFPCDWNGFLGYARIRVC